VRERALLALAGAAEEEFADFLLLWLFWWYFSFVFFEFWLLSWVSYTFVF
jgi:hypothetical protein